MSNQIQGYQNLTVFSTVNIMSGFGRFKLQSKTQVINQPKNI